MFVPAIENSIAMSIEEIFLSHFTSPTIIKTSIQLVQNKKVPDIVHKVLLHYLNSKFGQ